MADKKLSVLITGDAKGAQKALGALERSAGKAGKRTESALSGIAGRMADIGVAAAAFASFSAFDEAQKVAKQTEAVIASTGGVANVTAKDIGDLADSLSKKAAVDDELIQSGANVIATFTKIRNEVGEGNDIFNQATESALDLSVAMGTDMKSASILVGKALNDPIKGISAMSRAGVQFTAQQKEQVKALAESGDMLGAQKVILKELETQFGGSAEAQATSLGRAKVAVENLAESVGGVLAPALEGASDAVSGAADAFGELGAGAQQAVVGGAALGYAALRWGPQLLGAASAAKSAAGNVVAFGQLAAESMRTRPDGVTKTTAALETLSTTAPKATRAMKLFSVGLGAIGVAGLVYELYRFGDALGDIEVDAGKALGATDRELVEVARKLEAVGQARNAYTQAGEQDIASLYRFRDALKAAGESTRTVDAAIKEAEGSKKRASESTGKYAGKVDELTDAMDGTADAAEGAAPAVDTLASRTEAGAAAADRYEEAQQAATDALKNFYDQTTEALSGAIGAEAALDAFTESVAENGRTLDINTEAGRDNMSALISMKDAAVDAAIAVKDQGGTNRQAAATLQGYSARLAQAARDAGYTEDEVRLLIARMKLTPKDIETRFHNDAPQEGSKVAGYIGTIGRVPGYKSTTFDANISPALQKLAALQQASTNLGSGSMWAFSGRAKGGPVSAGEPYVVGEQGPEIIVPKSDGMVLTAGQTKQIMSTGGSAVGGGSTVHVTVNVAGSIRSDRDVAEVVRNELIDMGRRTGRPVLAGLA